MTTPAIKDKTLVSSTALTQGLSGKEPNISSGTTSQYYRGDKTWRDFAGDVRSVVLTGLSTATNAAITATDSVLGAFGKLQKQVTDLTTTVGGKISSTEKGAANGVAILGADSKVPSAQLPSYVDDVLEYATKSALPATGESGKIYLVLADETRNNATEQYRWSGSTYSRITTSPGSTDEVTEGVTRLYFTEARVRATILTGLSTATNAVIGAADSVLSAFGKLQKQITDLSSTVGGKEGAVSAGTTDQYYRGDKTWRDFASDVRSAFLTGLSTATNATITATDSVLGALGKLQKQITDLASTVSGKESSIAAGTTAQWWRGDKTWQSLPTSSTGLPGIVQLNNMTNSNSTTTAATAAAVKSAYDRGDASRDVPSNPQSVAYAITSNDRGKSIDTIADVVVPIDDNAINVGQTTTITNLSDTPITLIQDAGVTLRLAGTPNTGNRVIAGHGMVTVRKAGSNLWYVSGAGVS